MVQVVNIPQWGGSGGHIVSEANGYRSRENVIAAQGQGKLVHGLVMGRLTATGKLVPWVSGATDGSQNFAGILFESIDTTGGDVNVTAHVRDCEVQRSALALAGTPNDAAKNGLYAQMAAVGIALR